MLKNKHKRILTEKKLEFIFVRNAMLIIQQVKNEYKIKNSYFVKSWLKNKTIKLKRVGFYSASKRKVDNQINEYTND